MLMAKKHLRIVADGEEKPKLWQGNDPIFFHKSQVKLGMRLVYFGRRNHGELWEVIEIKTYRQAKTGSGRWITRQAEEIEKISDDVVVRRLNGNETKQLTFATLSYSAIWRLADAQT